MSAPANPATSTGIAPVPAVPDTATAPDEPTVHALHASLVRPVLYLGVDRMVIVLEATAVFALVLGLGVHVATVALALGIVVVLHPALVWLTARDPQAVDVYLRSRVYDDFYAPHESLARARAKRARAPKRAVPGRR